MSIIAIFSNKVEEIKQVIENLPKERALYAFREYAFECSSDDQFENCFLHRLKENILNGLFKKLYMMSYDKLGFEEVKSMLWDYEYNGSGEIMESLWDKEYSKYIIEYVYEHVPAEEINPMIANYMTECLEHCMKTPRAKAIEASKAEVESLQKRIKDQQKLLAKRTKALSIMEEKMELS